jgi:type IX secretion system PorP/SprF family membrane protein
MKKIFTTVAGAVLVALISTLGSLNLQAQNRPHYSMYMLQQPVINVGAMGSYDRAYVGLIFNTQLAGFDGAPTTGLIDFGLPVGKTNLVLGGHFSQQRIGVSNFSDASVDAAYRIKLDPRNFLSIGLGVGGRFANSNYAQLNNTWNDPAFAQDINYGNPTAKVGMFYFRQNFYVGVSVDEILSNAIETSGGTASPRVETNIRHMNFNLQSGFQVAIGKALKLQPSMLMKLTGSSPVQLDLNLHLLIKDAFGVGGSFRSTGTAVFLVDYTFKKTFTIGYSVNTGLYQRNVAFYHGHEVFMGLRFKSKMERAIPVDVPRF